MHAPPLWCTTSRKLVMPFSSSTWSMVTRNTFPLKISLEFSFISVCCMADHSSLPIIRLDVFLLNMYISRCTFPGLWPGFACRFILTLIVIVPPRPVKLPAYFPLAMPFYFSNFLCFLAFVLSAGPFLCCFSDFSAYAVLFISLLQLICTKPSHKTVNLHTSAQNFCATF